MTSVAAQHREDAAAFTAVVDGVSDWDAPAPVDGWTARDVVEHLVTWLPGFLAGGGERLERIVPGGTDPAAAWASHRDAVQALLEAPDADRPFTHPEIGTHPLDRALAQFYVPDVFMHTWDLSRASGQDVALDEGRCAALLDGMRSVEELLRASGHYGPAVPVRDDAPVQDRLVAFIGRDPAWTPPV